MAAASSIMVSSCIWAMMEMLNHAGAGTSASIPG
jgi:hypothetical protein